MVNSIFIFSDEADIIATNLINAAKINKINGLFKFKNLGG